LIMSSGLWFSENDLLFRWSGLQDSPKDTPELPFNSRILPVSIRDRGVLLDEVNDNCV
jgi:hypothetical protein